MAPTLEIEQKLIANLRAIVGWDGLIDDPRHLRLYRGGPWGPVDPTGRFGCTPILAVRPGDGQQVAACLREIVTAGRPAIALGGGTGVTGATSPTDDAVVVDLCRLDGPVEIDRASRQATVGAAVKLGALAAEAEAAGLLFAHDPWSQPIASVGGAIATNGVGYLAAGYGTMGDQVLGLEVALTTGELLRLPAAQTSSTGPNLSRLFVGSEGTLGVIVAATVRLFPMPERRQFAAFRFPTFEDGFAVLQDSAAIGLRPALIDYEEDDDPPTATLFAAFDGVVGAVDAEVARLAELASSHSATPLPSREATRFWRERHESARRYAAQLSEHRERLLAAETEPPSIPRRGGWRYVHLALPAGAVLPLRARAKQLAETRGLVLASAGIWGMPELFSFVVSGEPEAADRLAEELQLEAAAMGGSMEYCHGVGLRLAHLMPRALGSTMPVLARLKRALDPSGLLNPGKQGLPPIQG